MEPKEGCNCPTGEEKKPADLEGTVETEQAIAKPLHRPPELLEVYDLAGHLIGKEERGDFYRNIVSEYREMGVITRKIKISALLLMTTAGRIYIQERSHSKNDNPGLYDKSVGGHVQAGMSFEDTIELECNQEIGVPAKVTPSENFYKMATEHVDLNTTAVLQKIGYNPLFMSTRIQQDGTSFEQPWMITHFMGYYDGPIKFKDGESIGIRVYSFNELTEAMRDTPEKFTDDLKAMIPFLTIHLQPLK